MADELDERASHEPSNRREGSDHVDDGEDGKDGGDGDHQRRLLKETALAEPRKTLVPDGSQQLLTVSMRHELTRKNNNHADISATINSLF